MVISLSLRSGVVLAITTGLDDKKVVVEEHACERNKIVYIRSDSTPTAMRLAALSVVWRGTANAIVQEHESLRAVSGQCSESVETTAQGREKSQRRDCGKSGTRKFFKTACRIRKVHICLTGSTRCPKTALGLPKQGGKLEGKGLKEC